MGYKTTRTLVLMISFLGLTLQLLRKKNIINILPKTIEGTFYINTFKLNSRTQIRFRKARENHENSLHTINTLIDEILLKFQHNAELHDLKDLIFQFNNLRHLKQQELDKLP